MVDFHDDILNFMIKAFDGFLHGNVYEAGLSKLLNQAEFQDYQKMQKLIKAVDNEEFTNVLTDASSSVKIVVGSENMNEGLDECAVVSVPYFINDDEFGTILLVGPTRMNYRATVPLLEYVAKSMRKLDKR